LKPETFKGYPVLDGDKTDIEMLKVSGFVLALRAKGKAKKDSSGFVVRESQLLPPPPKEIYSLF
jgi:hypothetical protein